MNSFKRWEEMEKYKEFKKENFEGAERFSKYVNKIWKILSWIAISIIVVFLLCVIIFIAIPLLIEKRQSGIFGSF